MSRGRVEGEAGDRLGPRDRFRFDSDRLETLQIRRPEMVEIGGVGPALTNPDAGIDQNDPAILADRPGMNAEQHVVARADQSPDGKPVGMVLDQRRIPVGNQ